jgi:hypothetical protein
MNRFVPGLARHIRANAIAYLALICSLGGTSYAALSLPAGSVGSRELRNHSITPVKFDPRAVAGSVRFWAKISSTGRVIASQPRAETVGWSPPADSGRITWGRSIPAGCFSLATVDGLTGQGFASVATLNQARPPAYVVVQTFNGTGQSAAEPVNVAVVCP